MIILRSPHPTKLAS